MYAEKLMFVLNVILFSFRIEADVAETYRACIFSKHLVSMTNIGRVVDVVFEYIDIHLKGSTL